VNRELTGRVWLRAANRCEYCQLPSQYHPAPFQIDHIIARQHAGETELASLALCCLHCNVRKGPNIAGIDPATGALTRLYNPRGENWAEHFAWSGAVLIGLTAIARVTIQVLGMNEPDLLEVRSELMRENVFHSAG
jgi:hypothetical protein